MKIEKNITICFDTNIYDNTNYFFNGSFYTTFKDLKMSYPNLKIYVEPIIYNEVITHLRNLAKDTTKETEKLLKIFKSLDIFTNVKEALEITDLEEKYFQEAKKKFEEFIKFFSDEEIEKSFNYEISEILNDYFKGNPPFENKKDKKNEFPDALIIQNLKNKFQNHENLFIVSTDNGFIEAVKKNIPNSRTFKNYADCADLLNKQKKYYKEAHKNVENLVDEIKRVIKNRFGDLLSDFVPIEYAEDFGIKIDVTNYDRKGYTEFSDLDEAMINQLDLNGYRIRILAIDSEKESISAEITFTIKIEILGREDESDDLIIEKHEISYKVDVKVNSESDVSIEMPSSIILLNRDSLIARKVERDYFDNYFDDYEPSLHPTSDTYTIVCDSCEFCNEFSSPEIDDFEITSSERGMGDETLYHLTIDEICQNCTQPLTLEIYVSIYPYLTFNHEDIYCSGGTTDLSFELS